MRTQEKRIYPEFEITEQYHETHGISDLDDPLLWHRIQKTAELFEQRLGDSEFALNAQKENRDVEKRKFLIELIEEIMDNLDRIISTSNGKKADQAAERWVKRFRTIRRKMEELLAKEQVIAIDLLSAPPGLVTADGTEDRDDVEDGTIISVNWRGYLWRGEILRKASVVVATNMQSQSCEGVQARENGGDGEWQK
jgi:molecular chaperone GrpE (heat shock protein)